MDYYNPLKDKKGYIHSIDMIYVEYLVKGNFSQIIDILRDYHFRFPFVDYGEYLDRKPCSKYDFYLDAISMGGVYVQLGKYTNYDRMSKTFDLLDMIQIRINPNKHMNDEWFKGFFDEIVPLLDGGSIRKYDYAIDLSVPLSDVQVFHSRKEKGLYKGTRYLGQSGRHGYMKIYDKAKELNKKDIECPDVLTRLEYTFVKGNAISLDDVYVCVSNELESSTKLNDTDKAIVDMYNLLQMNGISYDLVLGRGKSEKLQPFLHGRFELLEYGNYLDDLIKHMEFVFVECTGRHLDMSLYDVDDCGFIKVNDDVKLPFD